MTSTSAPAVNMTYRQPQLLFLGQLSTDSQFHFGLTSFFFLLVSNVTQNGPEKHEYAQRNISK